MLPAGSVNQAMSGPMFWRSASSDAFFIGHVVVVLEFDALGGQLVDGLVDVVDGEIQDRVCRWNVIGLGVDVDGVWAGDLQLQGTGRFVDLESKRLAIELFRCC